MAFSTQQLQIFDPTDEIEEDLLQSEDDEDIYEYEQEPGQGGDTPEKDDDFYSISLKPPEKMTRQVAMATVFTTMGCINFGYALGWTSQSVNNIADDPDMPSFSSTQNSWTSVRLSSSTSRMMQTRSDLLFIFSRC